MTEALDAMVKAMVGEIERQALNDDGTQSFPSVGELRDGRLLGFDGLLDLEKVARAGLLAIREPTTDVILAGSDVPDSVQRFWPPMIDAILNDKPRAA